jgi:hypothetical protein
VQAPIRTPKVSDAEWINKSIKHYEDVAFEQLAFIANSYMRGVLKTIVVCMGKSPIIGV